MQNTESPLTLLQVIRQGVHSDSDAKALQAILRDVLNHPDATDDERIARLTRLNGVGASRVVRIICKARLATYREAR